MQQSKKKTRSLVVFLYYLLPVLYFSTSRVPANTNGDSYSSATEEPLAARVNSDHHLAFMI